MEQRNYINKVHEIFKDFGYVKLVSIQFNCDNISFIYYVMHNRVDKLSLPYRFIKENELKDYIIGRIWI